MPLPENISVRYTEDEAGYISVRPVVRQSFQLAELADMVVSVAGKNVARVAQIFRAGTVVYNGYRYWWEGFSAQHDEISALLAPFPEDDASRPFRAEEVAAVILETGGGTQRTAVELTREEADRRRLLRRRSPWDCLLELVRASQPHYESYSYAQRGDLYRASLSFDAGSQLLRELLEAAPRSLRARLAALRPPAALIFLCPRARGSAPQLSKSQRRSYDGSG